MQCYDEFRWNTECGLGLWHGASELLLCSLDCLTMQFELLDWGGRSAQHTTLQSWIGNFQLINYTRICDIRAWWISVQGSNAIKPIQGWNANNYQELFETGFKTMVQDFWHRYLIEVDCSSGHFKSAKLKDKVYTINAQSFFTTMQKRKRLMHQVFNICWPMVSCWFMLLMLYLPLLDICDFWRQDPRKRKERTIW